jgi:LmbE family N-acetylglucosaminyl deacetylase
MTDAPAPGDALEILRSARTVLLAHAHPDDETLATGALIASLVRGGVACPVVTATRGEQGEIVPGAIPEDSTQTLEQVRVEETAAALAALGAGAPLHLGESPALADGAEPRVYRDSGMQWVRPGLAGPTDAADERSFTAAPIAQAAADLAAAITRTEADCVVSYADDGSYGHPDHVRMHHVAREAAALVGVPFLAVASEETLVHRPLDKPILPAQDDDFDWIDLPGVRDAVAEALGRHRSQLSVLEIADLPPGVVRVRHVGGQLQDVWCRSGLRRVV